ncbi:MAG: single-stranded-DNA-specific exonuclease RecJ [Salaquimonas sp.]
MKTPSKEDRAFLDVSNSLSGKRWIERLDGIGRNQALKIAQISNIPDLVARVLAGRGVVAENAEQFLVPTIRDLMPDPSVLTDMDVAAERLADAVLNNERVAIFGDYDVDGACSSALLSRFLTELSIKNEIYIPDRIFEGYGPNPDAIGQLIERGAKLIVTVDCGATSFEALEEAKRLGVDVVVLDHHQMGTEKPPALALVNPNRQDDLSGLGYLCAAGVVFMALVALQRELRKRGNNPNISLLEMLDIVALATVCDVVPLKGLNRAFVVKGMQVFRQQSNMGLLALSKAARLDGPITPYHLGFLLGPRINAGGRIGDAALGSRLLINQSEEEAAAIASQLDDLNKERQAAEAIMLEEAIAEGEAEMGPDGGPSILITARKGWHPGIVGLLASRLKDRFSRPAFAIAFDGNGKGSGSGRSIPGVDLGEAVRAGVEAGILEKGGGHVMAAGLTVRHEKLGELRAFLDDRLKDQVAKSADHLSIKIDGALTARSATVEFCDLLEQAGPYGAGHSQPIFAFPNHLIRDSRIVGRDHVSLTLQSSDGKTLRAIAFRKAEEPLGRALLEGQGKHFHLCGIVTADYWQGSKRPQLRILDVAKS